MALIAHSSTIASHTDMYSALTAYAERVVFSAVFSADAAAEIFI